MRYLSRKSRTLWCQLCNAISATCMNLLQVTDIIVGRLMPEYIRINACGTWLSYVGTALSSKPLDQAVVYPIVLLAGQWLRWFRLVNQVLVSLVSGCEISMRPPEHKAKNFMFSCALSRRNVSALRQSSSISLSSDVMLSQSSFAGDDAMCYCTQATSFPANFIFLGISSLRVLHWLSPWPGNDEVPEEVAFVSVFA